MDKGLEKKYKISHAWDKHIKDVHHIGIGHEGDYYSVVFGRYVNGGFFSIPNWDCGGELASFTDVLWNEESICKALGRKEAAKVIALAIAEHMENMKDKTQ